MAERTEAKLGWITSGSSERCMRCHDGRRTLPAICPTPGETGDTGNLFGYQEYWGGPGSSSYKSFVQVPILYDGVNRLIEIDDSGWSRKFAYDQWGNMAVSSNTGLIPNVNTPQAVDPATIYDANNHRKDSGQGYDPAGNVTAMKGFSNLTYDAENRLLTASAPMPFTYSYDGDGRRVMKTGGGVTTVFVYDALGELAAEYSNAANTSACLTCYLSYDHLGTTRLVTNGSGQVVSRHDYLPFGEEIPSGVGGRDGTWGSGADGVNQKFTGKERDSETGLDYFGARYYGGALGRFTNPDDPSNDQDEHDPQSWNLYSGVRNNPLRNIDPNGEDCITTSNQTSSGVTVTTERGGSTTTCSGTYVNGTVDVNSFSYNGGSLGYSFANDTASGAGTIQFGQIQSDDALSPDVANALRQSGVMAFPLVNLTAQGLKFGASVAFPFTSLLGNAVVGSDSTAAKVAGVSRKPGKLGQFKGTDSLRRENKIARDIIKQLNLQGKRAEQVHDIIQGASIDAGEKLGYTELLEIVKTTLGLL